MINEILLLPQSVIKPAPGEPNHRQPHRNQWRTHAANWLELIGRGAIIFDNISSNVFIHRISYRHIHRHTWKVDSTTLHVASRLFLVPSVFL
jgi:hypothetical protein